LSNVRVDRQTGGITRGMGNSRWQHSDRTDRDQAAHSRDL